MIDVDSQKWCCATTGMLLYLIKLLRLDIANSVRELSKVMDGASPAHEKELKRILHFIVSEKKRDSKLKHIVIWPGLLMLMAIVTLPETMMTGKASSLCVEWLFLGNLKRNQM
jgi:predicted transcriptional regulator